MFHVIRRRRGMGGRYLVFTFTPRGLFVTCWERLFANGPQVLESRLQE